MPRAIVRSERPYIITPRRATAMCAKVHTAHGDAPQRSTPQPSTIQPTWSSLHRRLVSTRVPNRTAPGSLNEASLSLSLANGRPRAGRSSSRTHMLGRPGPTPRWLPLASSHSELCSDLPLPLTTATAPCCPFGCPLAWPRFGSLTWRARTCSSTPRNKTVGHAPLSPSIRLRNPWSNPRRSPARGSGA